MRDKRFYPKRKENFFQSRLFVVLIFALLIAVWAGFVVLDMTSRHYDISWKEVLTIIFNVERI